MKVTVIPIIVGELGTTTKGLIGELADFSEILRNKRITKSRPDEQT